MNGENNIAQTTQETSSVSEKNGSSSKIIIGAVIFIIALLALVTVLIMSSKKNEEISTESEPAITQEVPQIKTSISADIVVTEDQVLISEANIVSYGFITVHEDDNGTPGTVIGISPLLKTGNYKDVAIPLDRFVEDGEVLYIQIVSDNADNVFNYPGSDQLVLTEEGSPIWATITVAFPEETEDADADEEVVATESGEVEISPTESPTPTENITE